MIPFGRPRNGEYDDLPSARSRAERVRVLQGWAIIVLSITNIILLLLRT